MYAQFSNERKVRLSQKMNGKYKKWKMGILGLKNRIYETLKNYCMGLVV